jgi:hypothetical protein
LIDKDRRMKSLPSPKMILVGGSNAAFGLDSEKLEKELKLPIVNLALTYGLGLPYMLRQAKAGMRFEDGVILSPEYELFYEAPVYRSQIILAFLYPSSILYMADEDPAALFREFRRFTRDTVRSYLEQSYAYRCFYIAPGLWNFSAPSLAPKLYERKSLNDRGDMTAHLGDRPVREFNGLKISIPKKPAPRSSLWGEPFANAMGSLVKFQKEADRAGALMAVQYPPVPLKFFESRAGDIHAVWDALFAAKIPALDAPEDRIYPAELFFDTHYHLSAQGRRRRTEELIRQWKKWRPGRS